MPPKDEKKTETETKGTEEAAKAAAAEKSAKESDEKAAGEQAEREAKARSQRAARPDLGRIATVHPNASECIMVGDQPVLFATANVNGERGRISQFVPSDIAERLLAIPIFQRITISDELADSIDDQLEKIARGQVASAVAVDERDRTIEELQNANRAMSRTVDELRKRVADLEAQLKAK